MAKKPAIPRDIILLISVPLLLATILAAVVYVPQWLARPAHDFIYEACNSSYRCSKVATVQGDTIEINKTLYESKDSISRSSLKVPELRYYDVSTGLSRGLTADEAEAYRVSSAVRDPDGYMLAYRSPSSSFLGGSYDNKQWMLQSGLYKRYIDLFEPTQYSSRYYTAKDVRFIGWVK